MLKNELGWRRQLRAVSLVTELDVPDREVREILHALGRLYPDAPPDDAWRLLQVRFPAALIIGLAGIGAQNYHQGNYWSGVWDTAGFRATQHDQQAWADAFRRNLDLFGLARFSGLTRVNVDEILMHSGVPVYCLADLLRMLIRREQAEPGVTGREVLTWARTAPEHQIGVDKPVLRFLRQGGDYAADFVDRCLDLVNLLASPDRPDLDPAELSLPRRIVDEAVRLANLGELDLAALRTAARQSSPRYGDARARAGDSTSRDSGSTDPAAGPVGLGRPQVRLDPYNNGVVLWLPPVGEAPDGRAVWTVTTDSVVNRVRTRSIWPGTTETAPETVLPLNQPVRSIDVRLDDSSPRYELTLVDKDDPLLVFTEDGMRIGPADSLPQGPVWLLHPDPKELGERDLEAVGGTPAELEDAPPPYGWSGWLLRHVDLTGVQALGYAGRQRFVHTARRAHLELPSPLRNVTTVFGTPVLGAPPRLSLPVETVPVTWAVRVRRPGAHQSLAARDVTVGAIDTVVDPVGLIDPGAGDDVRAGSARPERSATRWVDPWEGLPRPLLGAYEVTVRGPLGRGLTRVVEIAEGLVVRSDPPWREMSLAGLVPAGLTLQLGTDAQAGPAGGGGPGVSPARVSLGRHEITARVTASAHGHSRQLLAGAPYMALRRVVPGARNTWSYQPLRLHAETDGRGELLVQLPAAVPAELVVSAGDQELQRIPRTRDRQTTVARFDLTRLADTVARYRRAVVEVDLSGLRIPVIRYAPRRLATGIEIIPTEGAEVLSTQGFPGVGGVVAGCYQLYAPWRPPVLVTLDEAGCSGPLPAELRDAGPLLVVLRLDDPWVPVDWPDWPDPRDYEDVYLLRDRLWRAPADPSGPVAVETELSACLAGRGGQPRSAGGAVAALRLYGVAEDLRRRGLPRDGRPVAAALLAAHPSDALAAPLTARVDATASVAPLVQAGLAALPLGSRLSADDERALWSASPLAAILAGAVHLRAASGPRGVQGRPGSPDPRRFDPGWAARQTEREQRREAQRDRLGSVAGEVALVVLDGGSDPHRTAGRFDAAVARFAQLPPDQLENVWRASGVVPGALLDADTRAVAARRLFDARNQEEIRDLARTADVTLRRVLAALTLAEVPSALEAAIAARRDADAPRWLLLPAVSLGLAGLARQAARSDDRDRSLKVYQALLPAHTALARHAPDLVTIDVLLAELLLRGAAPRRPAVPSAGIPSARQTTNARQATACQTTNLPRELKGDR
ncbi:hypothetical protein [Parafrankia sp. Ea1.12]|uniref:hypothetical protein n=1 Tax=Parafrankia sp. Ea1.12 TaxID=573499 RepID=UPI0011BE44B6|nr:hypothetical protein [Parafrankia sp. Ea1.12]